MSEISPQDRELTTRIADNIKAKYQKELIDKEHQLHIAKVLKDRAPLVWKKLVEEMSAMTQRLGADLGATGAVDLKFTNPSSNQMSISKTEMPHVAFILTLKNSPISVEGTLTKADPRLMKDKPGVTAKLLIEFTVNQDDTVTAIFLGEQFHEGTGLAEKMFETVFA
jgi:hypothetical protein